MGGRGASSSGGGTGGINPADIVSTTSLISKEGKAREIAESLTVLRDVERDYGVVVTDAEVAVMKGRGKNALAYYDPAGNVAVNEDFFDTKKMNGAYDESVMAGFHPKRGQKTGLEAVVAHEMGHRLTDEAAMKMGLGRWNLDMAADNMVKEAAKQTGHGRATRQFMKKISGYAYKGGAAEAVAEAFADVYCNGKKAKKESKALINVLNSTLKGGG